MTIKEQIEAEIADLEAKAAAARAKLAALPEEAHGIAVEVWEKIKAFFGV